MMCDGQEVLVSADNVQSGDEVRIHMGNVIPFDGDGNGWRGNGKSGIFNRRIGSGPQST